MTDSLHLNSQELENKIQSLQLEIKELDNLLKTESKPEKSKQLESEIQSTEFAQEPSRTVIRYCERNTKPSTFQTHSYPY